MSRTTAEYVGYDPLRVLRFVHERVFFGEHKVLTIPPFIPVREHGAWVMIIAPMVSGMLFAPELSWNMLLYGIAVLCVFMAYPSAEQLFRIWSGAHRTAEERCGARVWTAVFVLTGAAAVIPLLWQGYGMILVLGSLAVLFFGLHVVIVRIVHDKLFGDLPAVIAATLSGPGMVYVGGENELFSLLEAWLPPTLFILLSVTVVHVHLFLKNNTEVRRTSSGMRRPALWLTVWCWGTGLTVSIIAERIPVILLLAYVPLTAEFLAVVIRRQPARSLKSLGFRLLVHTVAFLALAAFVIL